MQNVAMANWSRDSGGVIVLSLCIKVADNRKDRGPLWLRTLHRAMSEVLLNYNGLVVIKMPLIEPWGNKQWTIQRAGAPGKSTDLLAHTSGHHREDRYAIIGWLPCGGYGKHGVRFHCTSKRTLWLIRCIPENKFRQENFLKIFDLNLSLVFVVCLLFEQSESFRERCSRSLDFLTSTGCLRLLLRKPFFPACIVPPCTRASHRS